MFLVDDKLFCNFSFLSPSFVKTFTCTWQQFLTRWYNMITTMHPNSLSSSSPSSTNVVMSTVCYLANRGKSEYQKPCNKRKEWRSAEKKRKRSWEMSCLASLAVPTSCWSDGNNKWWNPTLQMTQSSLCPVHTSALANGESGTEINVDVSSWWFDPSKPNSRRFILSIHP